MYALVDVGLYAWIESYGTIVQFKIYTCIRLYCIPKEEEEEEEENQFDLNTGRYISCFGSSKL
jgi:hypothetical protein